MSAITKFAPPELRLMTDADLPQVLKVEHASYEFPWTLGIFKDCLRVGYHCYVYEGERGILGHGVTSITAGECHLLNVCIHPDWQRHGYGRRLVQFLLDVAREKKAHTALLEVRVSNTGAYLLYQSLGFNEVGMRRHYYPGRVGREDALILARDIQEPTS